MEKIRIIPYEPAFQPAIDLMMTGIALEFTDPINSPQSTNISQVYRLPGNTFWIALHRQQVVGTIGIVMPGHAPAVIKRFFVDQAFRGATFNTAKLLLDAAIDLAKRHQVSGIWLGTMAQFKAARKFYSKHGFIEVRKEALPAGFDPNPIDSVFYKLELR